MLTAELRWSVATLRDICELVSGILTDSGYATRTASDSDTALNEIAKRCPSLVLLDIWLQGSRLDGLEVLKLLKERLPNLPVVNKSFPIRLIS